MVRPFAPAGVATAVVSLALSVPAARAQYVTTAEVGVEATHIQLDGYEGAAAGTVSGDIASDGDFWHVQAAVATSRFETGHITAYGSAAGTLDLFRTSSWSASWSADAGSGAFRGNFSGQYLRTSGRIAYAVSSISTWVLGSVGQSHTDATYTTRRGEAGVGIVERTFSAAATVDRADAGGFIYNDAEARAAWQWHRLELNANTGIRFGNQITSRTSWGNAQATLNISNALQLAVTGGSEPTDPERAVLGAKFFSIGMHLHAMRGARPGVMQSVQRIQDVPSSVSSVRVSAVQPDGSRFIVIQLEHAERVDIIGDFTEWEPVSMHRTSEHTWTIMLPISTGAHRLNIRIDGGTWQVPPGMPALPDDFGGSVGVIAVE